MALTVTPTDEMKTLKVGEKIYEIVDDEARTDLNTVKADFLQSLIYDTASGSVATFPDGAHELPCKSVVAQIVPIQDLHGYDSPWPAGGGINKIDVNQLAPYGTTYGLRTSFDGDWIVLSGEYTSATQNANYRIAKLSDGSVFPVTKFKAFPDSNTSSHMTSSPFGLADGNKTLTIYISGMVQGETYNLRFKIVGYEGDTAPTEWTPYSNICPVSGWDAVNVVQRGKNLFDAEGIVESSGHPTYCYIDGDYLKFKTGNTTQQGINWTDLNIPCPVTFHGTAKNFGIDINTIGLTFSFADGTSTSRNTSELSANASEVLEFTIGSVGQTITRITSRWTNGQDAGFLIADTQLELGSTATPYEPYTGSTYSVSLPQTVYGGQVDVVSGEGKIVYASAVLDGTEPWDNRTGYSGVYSLTVSNIKPPASSTTVCDAISDYLPSISQTALVQETSGVAIFTWESQIVVRLPDVTTLADFKAYLSEHPLTVVYPLITPTDFSVTPQTVPTLYGSNTVYADSGDVSVEYPADTKLYINKVVTDAVSALS